MAATYNLSEFILQLKVVVFKGKFYLFINTGQNTCRHM